MRSIESQDIQSSDNATDLASMSIRRLESRVPALTELSQMTDLPPSHRIALSEAVHDIKVLALVWQLLSGSGISPSGAMRIVNRPLASRLSELGDIDAYKSVASNSGLDSNDEYVLAILMVLGGGATFASKAQLLSTLGAGRNELLKALTTLELAGLVELGIGKSPCPISASQKLLKLVGERGVQQTAPPDLRPSGLGSGLVV